MIKITLLLCTLLFSQSPWVTEEDHVSFNIAEGYSTFDTFYNTSDFYDAIFRDQEGKTLPVGDITWIYTDIKASWSFLIDWEISIGAQFFSNSRFRYGTTETYVSLGDVRTAIGYQILNTDQQEMDLSIFHTVTSPMVPYYNEKGYRKPLAPGGNGALQNKTTLVYGLPIHIEEWNSYLRLQSSVALSNSFQKIEGKQVPIEPIFTFEIGYTPYYFDWGAIEIMADYKTQLRGKEKKDLEEYYIPEEQANIGGSLTLATSQIIQFMPDITIYSSQGIYASRDVKQFTIVGNLTWGIAP
jgi:hypothetical protein